MAGKLHILIDSDIRPIISEGDVVLISRYNSIYLPDDVKLLIDYDIINCSFNYRNEILSFFESLDDSYFKIINRSYVKFFAPLLTVLANVERVLDNIEIDEIVLYEGSVSPYFTTIGAEGEGSRRFYKTNWMVNAYIFTQFSRDIKISWKGKKTVFYYSIIDYFFYNFNIIRELTIRVTKYLQSFFGRYTKQVPLIDCNVISVISLNLQKRHLDSILKDVINAKHLYFSYDKNLVDNNTVLPIKELPFIKLIKIYITDFFYSITPNVKFRGINSRALYRELKFCKFVYDVYEERLFQTMSMFDGLNGMLMLSNTTAGDDMMAIHSVSKSYSMRHVNLQYVSMGKVLYPNLELADEYYLYAPQTYELYSNISSSFHFYLPLKKSKRNNTHNIEPIITIFTQPDSYSNDYIFYLNELCPKVQNSNMAVELIIKPHYRQNNLQDYYDISKKYSFVKVASPDENIAEILNKTDMAVSMHSSVIFEAMMERVPTIIYNPNHKYDKIVYNNDFCYPSINFVTETPQQTIPILCDIEKYKKDFNKRLDAYIISKGTNSNIEELLKL